MGNLLEGGFSRRSFIKGAAALTSVGALATLEPQLGTLKAAADEAPRDQIFSGACRGNCGGGCFLDVHVRDGQVVRTTAREMPDPAYTRICCKGLTHVGRMYGPDRLLYPMKRTGERGSGEFERITWDEALDMIAEKWGALREEFGPESVMFFMGSGNYAALSGSANSMGAYQRFVNALGCSYCSLDVDVGVGYGTARADGGIRLNNELTDRKNAKTLVIWGNNPTISLMHTMHFFIEAQEQGTRLVVIDPVFNASSSKADWWIPIKAGTDGALALGVLNVLLENGWVDSETLRSKTNCGLLIKDDGTFLRESDLGKEVTEGGENKPLVWDQGKQGAVPFDQTQAPALENVPDIGGFAVQTVYENAIGYISQYPAAVAAEICGLTEDDVRELARTYHEDGPVSTEVMMGMNHYRNAHYSSWPVWLISHLTGNVGAPGASLGASEEYLPQLLYSNLVGATYPVDESGTPCPGQANLLHTVELGGVMETGARYDGTPMPVKSAYIHCSNPVATLGEHDYTTSWFSKMDFVITADVCMTETCKWSDLVLPSAYWFEQEDMACLFSSHPYLLWQEKCCDPLGESRPDFDIFGAILDRLGLGEYWCTGDEFLETLLDTDYWRGLGVTLGNLKEKKALRIYPEGDYICQATPATETGRVQLYIENPTPAYDAGQALDLSIEHGLHWESPTFAGEDRDYRKTYPYHMLSEHMRTHTHTQWSDCDYVKEYEPEPIVRLNPDDAAELGVAEGDILKLYNDCGFVVMKANINAGVPRGMVTSARSWQADDFIDGHFASLPSREYNPMVANHAFNDCAVAIEKM